MFGAPSHRVESMLNSIAIALDIKAQFIQIPGVIMISFGDPSSTHCKSVFVKVQQGLDLGKTMTLQDIYRAVSHGRMSAEQGESKIEELIAAESFYSAKWKTLFAFLCGGSICALAFGGSFADLFVAGVLSAIMTAVNLQWASKNQIVQNVFE